jgi:hypothetical protein
VLVALLVATVATGTRTTPNVGLTTDFTTGQSGWGNAMNRNLARLDSVLPMSVLPGEDLQTAVNALDSTTGGEIRLGPGTFQLSSTLRLDRPVILRGAGPYTKIVGADPDSDVVLVTSPYVSLRDLQLMGQTVTTAALAGDGVGLRVRSDNSIIFDLIVENVMIANTGSWGIKLCGLTSLEAPDSSTYDIASPRFQRVTVYNARSGGLLYSGVGVAAPTFTDCNFTGAGFTPDSTDSWTWHNVIKCYGTLAPLRTLRRGGVYLFSTTDAVFDRCYFQPISVGAVSGDEPILSFEDCLTPQVRNSYFEVLDAASSRNSYMVTMSANQQFVFRDIYVNSNRDAPFRFMQTNATAESKNWGIVDGFYGLHGGTVATQDSADFWFNGSGDASGGDRIVLANVSIYNSVTGLTRDVDVRQTDAKTSAFPAQNVLLQNSARRFRLPAAGYGEMNTLATLKTGEFMFLRDTLYAGSQGALMGVGSNYSFQRIPFCPIYSDTTTRGLNYAAPREGDMVYVLSVHKLQVWDGTAWRDLH